VLLGVMGTHFAIERFSTIRRIEERLLLLNESVALADFPLSQQHAFRRATGAYVQLQQIVARLEPDENFFVKISEELLFPAETLLQQLACGRLIVPTHQIVAAQEKLSAVFVARFDAVSNQDIDFWDQSSESEDFFVSEAYLRQHSSAMRRGTRLTRIFIVSIRDLTEKRHHLIRVLTRHQRAGIEWGLAISDEFEEPLRSTSGRLDFALFDRGKAVSYLQRETPRRLEAVLRLKSLPANARVIDKQMSIHQELIAECWVASEAFVRDFRDIHGVEGNGRIDDMISRYNGYLRAVVSEVPFDHDAFIFVAQRTDEIEAKIQGLERLLRLYRESRGSVATGV
jgi:hypothetical protein